MINPDFSWNTIYIGDPELESACQRLTQQIADTVEKRTQAGMVPVLPFPSPAVAVGDGRYVLTMVLSFKRPGAPL